jgi:hypothetical protein
MTKAPRFATGSFSFSFPRFPLRPGADATEKALRQLLPASGTIMAQEA